MIRRRVLVTRQKTIKELRKNFTLSGILLILMGVCNVGYSVYFLLFENNFFTVVKSLGECLVFIVLSFVGTVITINGYSLINNKTYEIETEEKEEEIKKK